MMNMTHDEMNLLCIYQKKTRKATIKAINEMQQYLLSDELELLEMSETLLEKLEQMSDAEFEELEIFPDF